MIFNITFLNRHKYTQKVHKICVLDVVINITVKIM